MRNSILCVLAVSAMSCSQLAAEWTMPDTVRLSCDDYRSIPVENGVPYNNVWNKTVAGDLDCDLMPGARIGRRGADLRMALALAGSRPAPIRLSARHLGIPAEARLPSLADLRLTELNLADIALGQRSQRRSGLISVNSFFEVEIEQELSACKLPMVCGQRR